MTAKEKANQVVDAWIFGLEKIDEIPAVPGKLVAFVEQAINEAVAEKEREIYNLHLVTRKTMDFRVDAAVAEETERCAWIAETMTDGVHNTVFCTNIAAAIRKRVKP